MRITGLVALCAIVATAALPGTALARDKAEGWRNWNERANRIEDALLSAESPRLDSACKGVTGTVIGQGFQFPYWGQSLIQVCTVTQAAFHGSDYRKRSKQICKDLRNVAETIGKATDTPESGDAAATAKRISITMVLIREQVCQEVDGKKHH